MRRSNADLDRKVAALGDLSRDKLAGLWEEVHGQPPPKGIRQELLLRSATWHLQVKRLGGLRPDTRRLLKTAMADAEKTLSTKASSMSRSDPDRVSQSQWMDGGGGSANGPDIEPKSTKPRCGRVSPGTRLVRDWNGKTHVVDVIEEGFVFQAKVHKSLTAIARQITGAHWSGPRFFGL